MGRGFPCGIFLKTIKFVLTEKNKSRFKNGSCNLNSISLCEMEIELLSFYSFIGHGCALLTHAL